jgi:hypothetical protein
VGVAVAAGHDVGAEVARSGLHPSSGVRQTADAAVEAQRVGRQSSSDEVAEAQWAARARLRGSS